jgi:hypothetical protein
MMKTEGSALDGQLLENRGMMSRNTLHPLETEMTSWWLLRVAGVCIF